MTGRPRKHDSDGTARGRVQAHRAALAAQGIKHVTLPLSADAIAALDALAAARRLSRAETITLLIRDALTSSADARWR